MKIKENLAVVDIEVQHDSQEVHIKPIESQEIDKPTSSSTNLDISVKKSEGRHHPNSTFQKAWELHKWICSQPEFGKGKNNLVSFLIYGFSFIVACIPVYDILTKNSTYCDVWIQYVIENPVKAPHAIICPGEVGCMDCKPNQLKYNVWWNIEMLKTLNISNAHLNLIAETAQKQAFGLNTKVSTDINQYIRAAELLMNNVQEQLPETQVSFKIFWDLLVNVSPQTGYTLRTKSSNNMYTDGVNTRYEYLQPIPSWVNRSYCLLFENTTRYQIVNPLVQDIVLTMPQNSRYWLGNFTAETISTSDFYRNDLGFDPVHSVEVVFIRDQKKRLAACQTSMSAFQMCNAEYLQEVVLHVVHTLKLMDGPPLGLGRGFSFPERPEVEHAKVYLQFTEPVWHITKQAVYTWVASMELTMGIFCLFLGVSLFQVLSVAAGRIEKIKAFKILRFKKTYFQFSISVVLLISSGCLCFYDIRSLFAPSFTEKIALGDALPMPSIRVSMFNGMNFTKIKQLNISFKLLHYIHIASIMAPMERKYGGQTKATFPGMLPHYELKSLGFWKEENYLEGTVEGVISQLDTEYKDLAHRMDLDFRAPAFYLLEKLYVDKCHYIISCAFNKEELNNCCSYFRFFFVNEMDPSLVLNNSNRTFDIAESGKPDIKIVINESVLLPGQEYYRFMLESNFDVTDSARNWLTWKAIAQQISFGYIIGNSFIPYMGLRNSARSGFLSQIFMVQSAKKWSHEINAKYGNCIANSTCVREELGFTGKNIYIEKNCGCFVCNSMMNHEMQSQNKCCTPYQAVHCVANPLLNVQNYKELECKRSQIQWYQAIYMHQSKGRYKINNNCSINSENKLLSTKHPFLKTNGKGYSASGVFPHYPGKKAFSIHELRKSLLKFNCDSRFQSMLPCRAFEFSNSKTSFVKQGGKTTSVEIRIDRTSLLNNYKSDRSNRQYSGLEAFGIILGGLGLFLGLDILCLIESGIEYFKSRKASRKQNMEEAIKPIVLHLLRNFGNLPENKVDEHCGNSHLECEVQWQKNNKSKTPKLKCNPSVDNKVASKHLGNTSDHALPQVQGAVSRYAIFCLAAILLLLTGIGISAYVGSSDLLSATEYNLEVNKEIIGKEHPSFGICEEANVNENSLILKTANFTPAVLNERESICNVEMSQKPCSDLFENYIYTGTHHCWITNPKSRDFLVSKSLIQYHEFSFVIATLLKNPLSTWMGNPQDALSGKMMPIKWSRSVIRMRDGSTDTKIISYQEIRNMSCEAQEICPLCSATNRNETCCTTFHTYKNPLRQEDLSCHQVFKVLSPEASKWKAYNLLERMFPSLSNEYGQNVYKVIAFRRSTPHVFRFKRVPRHSLGAKISLIGGYVDLFLGISVVGFCGAAGIKCLSSSKK